MRLEFGFIVAAYLVSGASAFEQKAVETEVIDSPYGAREILWRTQEFFAPISIPGEWVYEHNDQTVYGVDWSNMPDELKKRMAATMEYGLPVYELKVATDALSRETVFRNARNMEIYRLPPPAGGFDADAWYWRVLGKSGEELDLWSQWIFDPAHTSVSILMVPVSLHSAFLAAQAEEVMLEAAMAPVSMMMYSSSVAVSNLLVSIHGTTNGSVQLFLDWPGTNFNYNVLDLFASTNLTTPTWALAGTTNISSLTTNHLDIGTFPIGPHSTRFFLAGTSQDTDGDQLYDAREIYLFGTLANQSDSDFDGILDGDEIYGDGSYGDMDGFMTNPLHPDTAAYLLPDLAVAAPAGASLAGFSAFDPPVTHTALVSGAPAIAEWTRINAPSDTMALTGDKLSAFTGSNEGRDTRFLFFGDTGTGKVLADGQILRLDGMQSAITLPEALPDDQMFLLWPRNDNGYGRPVAINQTEAWWVGPGRVAAGEAFSIYGRNLKLGNTDCSLYIDGHGWITNTTANPYKADFTLPASLTNGTYQLWAHNGSGVEYGWAQPLEITVRSAYPWDDDTNTWINVKDVAYGAVGDGVTNDWDAIDRAILDAKAGSYKTIYFPAGTYALSEQVTPKEDIRLIGAGMDQTTITTHGDFADTNDLNYGIFQGGLPATGPTEFHDMTLFAGSYLHLGDGNKSLFDYKKGFSDFRFENVRFDCSSMATNQSVGELWFTKSQRGAFIDCTFIMPRAVNLGEGARQILFDGCIFRGINDVDLMINIGAAQEVSIVDCLALNHDPSNSADGHGWAQGRFVYGSGKNGPIKNIYYGGNITSNLTVRSGYTANQNTGEQYMTEFGETWFRGSPVSAVTNTVTFASVTNDYTGHMVAIVGGKGLGQYRDVVATDTGANMITLDRDWNVLPDANSIISIGTFPARHALFNNYFDGVERAVTSNVPSTAGIMTYGAQLDLVAQSNTFHQLKHGISTWSISNTMPDGSTYSMRPNYFNLYLDNTLHRNRRAIDNQLAFFNGKVPNEWDVPILGNVWRNNSISNTTEYALRYRVWDDDFAFDLNVWDGNRTEDWIITHIGKDSNENIIVLKNQVWVGNDFNSDGSGIGFTQTTNHSPVLHGNTWTDFGTTYSGSTSATLELPVRIVPALAITNHIPVWNSGTAPLSWNASESSGWLSLISSSGTVADETAEGMLSFTINTNTMSGEAAITVVGNSQTQKVSVVVQ